MAGRGFPPPKAKTAEQACGRWHMASGWEVEWVGKGRIPERKEEGRGSAYLDMCSRWGRCAFSSPSLVKMPTKTITATTPQMM